MSDLDSFDQARLFYLSVLGLLILTFLFSVYRRRFGEALQHIAIWALIFVGVVLAFGFKDQLTAIIMGDQGYMVDERTISFNRADDGHFYARLSVNGEEIPFMIDTGATNLTLTRHAAAVIGFDVSDLAYTQQFQTANGTVRGAPVTLDSVVIGPIEDRNVLAFVNAGDLHISLLGMSYLKRFRSYRVDGNRMVLVR